jgi:multidrug transporter EmrE-like cation transporter
MTVAIQSESEVVRMSVLPKSKERRSLLSALETIQLILSFGMFTIALIKLGLGIAKNDKNNRSLTLAS